MTVQLGIDFGTSTTVAALRTPDGRTRPLVFDGSELLPSAVCAFDDGALLVGRDALHAARANPAGFEPNPKRSVDDGTVLLGGRELPVVTLFAAVLGRVAAEAGRVAGGPVPAVTLTCPAGWGPRRRETLIAAAEAAGLATPVLVAEPVAATGYFIEVTGCAVPVGACVVVYDFGAGTFDASVVRRSAAGFDVLAERGLPDAGGLDIDAAITAHLGTVYAPRDAAAWDRLIHPVTVADRRAALPFRDDVRAGKEILSRAPSTFVHVPLLDDDALLARDQLEQLARPILDRTVRTTRAVLREARVAPDRIAGLFLVGGSSRIPLVATLLHRELGLAPTVMERPELVVAEGSLHVRHAPPADATVVVPVAPTEARPSVRATAQVPVSAPPVSVPPVSLPPVSASPVSAPPVSAPPVSAPPVGPRTVRAGPPTPPPGAPYGHRVPWWRRGWRPELAWSALALLLLAAVLIAVDLSDGTDGGGATSSGSPAGDMSQTSLGTHGDRVSALAFSPDGRRLASAGYDGTVRLWGLPYGGEVGTLRYHPTRVLAVGFSPDGRTLMSADADGRVVTWDTTTMLSTASVASGVTVRGGLAFSPDATLAAAGAADGTVRVVTVADGRTAATLTGAAGVVDALVFSPDGRLLAGSDGELRVWSVTSGQLTVGRPGTGVIGMAFSPDSATIVTGGPGGVMKLWSTSAGPERSVRVAGHTASVPAMAFDPTGTLLVSADDSGVVRLRDRGTALGMSGGTPAGSGAAPSGSVGASIGGTVGPVDHVGYVGYVGGRETPYCAAFSPDGKLVAIGAGRSVSLWRVP